MPSTTRRGRRGRSARRRRSSWNQERTGFRYQPPRRRRTSARRGGLGTRRSTGRRRSVVRRRRSSRWGFGRSMKTAVVVASVIVVLAVLVALLAGVGLGKFKRDLGLGRPAVAAGSVAYQVVYSARTANDAAIVLPATVQKDLLGAGLAHQSVELIRVGYTGEVSGSPIDMTPRTGNSPADPPLRVSGREVPAVDAKISGIQADVNAGASGAGGRALFLGLDRITFANGPVIIISSGLDLANPDNFRALAWSVPAAQLVADVRRAGDLPALHGPVTFVLVPTTGAQQQLGHAQETYLETVWTALLKAAGATSVRFVAATGTTAGPAAPAAPTVQVPPPIATPIRQVRVPGGVTCTVPDSYFEFDKAQLIDPAQTAQNLTSCIHDALAAHAAFALDGWTSYEGPLIDGRPEFDYAYNQTLSDQRVTTIANLLVDELNVPRADITHRQGHGNEDQPDPGHPRSADNRVVVIRYSVK
jgi:outer membrane protein OmpA-like peptidoglycan-associated protein